MPHEEEMVEQAKQTLLHEIGHYLGIDEGGCGSWGLARARRQAMSEMPGAGARGGPATRAAGDNGFLRFLQQPRVLLILLAAWEIVAVWWSCLRPEDSRWTSAAASMASWRGRLLSWQSIPLAVLYLYCARDPERFQGIFWLALIEQGAAIAANLYHLAADHLEFEAIFIPVVVSASLGLLAFVNVFQRGEPAREYA